jgi:nitrite reductase/ring-hydroxylating ferredoxin subunit
MDASTEESSEEHWCAAGAADALGDGDALRIDAGEHRVAVFNLSGTFYAISDICTHERAYLSDGYVDGDTVECPLHQALFHIPTGRVLAAPAVEGVRTYPVRICKGTIEVCVSGSAKSCPK